MSSPKPPVFTIGHSNRSIEAFIALLEGSGVRSVVDVRRFPGSRAMPQFGGEALAQSLASAGIGYLHLAALGGRRARGDDTTGLNDGWRNAGFRAYADYALTAAFREGLGELEALAAQEPCAVMCAEAVWWRCHRRIIADYLLRDGWPVRHILGPGKVTAATPTPEAVIGAAGITYPAPPPD